MYLILLCCLLWITECIPLYVTSMLPIFAVPVLGLLVSVFVEVSIFLITHWNCWRFLGHRSNGPAIL